MKYAPPEVHQENLQYFAQALSQFDANAISQAYE
jgi:hypothetical protein